MSEVRALRSILLVEDHPDHRNLAERALVDAGLVVRTASSGEQALTMVGDADLVLVDYGLPRMNGIEVLEAIRAQSGPPVVLVTGMGSEALAVAALKGGAVDYIVKTPGFLHTLPEAVKRAWRAHDLRQRAVELQRLTLLVAKASDRSSVLHEIAHGARSLLGATACAVFVAGEGGLSLEALDGPASPAIDILADAPPNVLRVPLPGSEDADQGVLVVISNEPRHYMPEEVELARTFASFAGLTLTNISRLELERDLRGRLQEMLDVRTQLVESVSHEFRTPLTAILGFTQLLSEGWDEVTSDPRHEMLANVTRNAEDLRRLVDELLDFSSVEHGKENVHLEDVDIGEVIRTTVESLDPLLRGRVVDIRVEPLRVRADPILVGRALNNLISNAVKYSAAETTIVVRTVVAQGQCRVEVTDHGHGLTPSEAARVFEPFWRAKWARWPRGAGIGLYLVQQYARLQNGESGVESEPGRGSTFYFTLPLEPAPVAA